MNPFIIAQASVIGWGHKQYGMPNDDAIGHLLINDALIAVVCDGASSADFGGLAATLIKEEALKKVSLDFNSDLIDFKNWKEYCTLLLNYLNEFLEMEVVNYHQTEVKGAISDYLTTIVLCIWMPKSLEVGGLYICHIGDSKAVYRDNEGNWFQIFNPHKGLYHNETYFLNNFNNDFPFEYAYQIIDRDINAVALMSDGLENASFLIKQEVMVPFNDFFEPNYQSLLTMHQNGLENEVISELFSNYLENGTPILTKEPDDKSMIIMALPQNQDK
jgi:hypothetical protein